MLSQTIVEFVESVHGDSLPNEVQVALRPEDCFAFLTFVSSFWQWRARGAASLN